MKNMKLTVYEEDNVEMYLAIIDDCLEIRSNVYGDDDEFDFDSEKIYSLTKKETKKLLELISIDDFVEKLRTGRCMFLESFLTDNKIKYESQVIW